MPQLYSNINQQFLIPTFRPISCLVYKILKTPHEQLHPIIIKSHEELPPIKIKSHSKFYTFIKKPKKLGSLTYGTCIKTNHMIRFLMQLYGSRNNHFLYIITFLDSLLQELQKLPTLKQIVSFDIGPKYIVSDYIQGHIIWELRSQALHTQESLVLMRNQLNPN